MRGKAAVSVAGMSPALKNATDSNARLALWFPFPRGARGARPSAFGFNLCNQGVGPFLTLPAVTHSRIIERVATLIRQPALKAIP